MNMVPIVVLCLMASASATSNWGGCPDGYKLDWNGRCVPFNRCQPCQQYPTSTPPPPTDCPQGQVRDPLTGQCVYPTNCPPGQIRDPFSGQCTYPPRKACPPGQVRDLSSGQCTCPPGQVKDPFSGQCTYPQPPACPPGQIRDVLTGQCVYPTDTCPPGQVKDPITGQCTYPQPPPCPQGQIRDVTGRCYYPTNTCPPGQIKDLFTGRCTCPPGQTLGLFGQCVNSTVQPPNPLCGPCDECCKSRKAAKYLYECVFKNDNLEICLKGYGFSFTSIGRLAVLRKKSHFTKSVKELHRAARQVR